MSYSSPSLTLGEKNLKATLDCPSIINGRPNFVFAAAEVLQNVDYFNTMLSGDFEEAVNTLATGVNHSSTQGLFTDEYDYEEDSDLEDEDVESHDAMEHPESPTAALSELTTALLRVQRNMEIIRRGAMGLFHGVRCRQIIVKDVAYVTWRAFIFYLYTEKLYFSELESSASYVSKREMECDDPPCSPKSMYRLADKFGLPKLQKLALDAIRERLTPRNIVPEVFSRFTSRYDEVREMQLDYLCTCYDDPAVAPALLETVSAIAAGEMPHADASLYALVCTRLAPRVVGQRRC